MCVLRVSLSSSVMNLQDQTHSSTSWFFLQQYHDKSGYSIYRGFHGKGSLTYLCALGLDRKSPLNELQEPFIRNQLYNKSKKISNNYSSNNGNSENKHNHHNKKTIRRLKAIPKTAITTLLTVNNSINP